MKKLLLVLGLLVNGSVSAITHTIINATPSAIQVQLDIRFAPDEFILLKPGEMKQVDVGVFPLRSIIAEAAAVGNQCESFANQKITKRIYYFKPWGRTLVVCRNSDGELDII